MLNETVNLKVLKEHHRTDNAVLVDLEYDPSGYTKEKQWIPLSLIEETWKNDDDVMHTVTSGTPEEGADGKFDSEILNAGSTFEHTFDVPGEYDYFCLLHPWMTGSVHVEP